MSLGGLRGWGGTFPPQVAVTYANQSGQGTPVCGMVEARTYRSRGRLPDDTRTNRPQRSENSIIDTNVINRVVASDKVLLIIAFP